MWRDILIILGFALAALAWFRITPKRMLGYATTARAEIAKRRPIQRVFLFFSIGLTIVSVYFIVDSFNRLEQPLPFALYSIVLIFWVWETTLEDVWKLSERGEKILDGVRRFGMPPLFIVAIVLWDMPLWQKIVYPLGGFALGVGVHKLKDFVKRKHKGKKPS